MPGPCLWWQGDDVVPSMHLNNKEPCCSMDYRQIAWMHSHTQVQQRAQSGREAALDYI